MRPARVGKGEDEGGVRVRVRLLSRHAGPGLDLAPWKHDGKNAPGSADDGDD